uniref:Uncharacterized protein n=1 Tax=Glossina palpalis gambiensis TaxID=67801 RepID=A0A1B0BLB5_9MUSC
MHQIHFRGGEDFRDLSKAVLFDAKRLMDLKGRVGILKNEEIEAKRLHRINIVHLRLIGNIVVYCMLNPTVGSKLYIADVLRRFFTLYNGHAPFIGFRAWLKPIVLILILDAICQILVVIADHLQDRCLYNNVSTDPLTQNLIQLDGTAWKELN